MNGRSRVVWAMLCVAWIGVSCSESKKKVKEPAEFVRGGTSEVMDGTVAQTAAAVRSAASDLRLTAVTTVVDTGKTPEGKADKEGEPITIWTFHDAGNHKVVITCESAGEHKVLITVRTGAFSDLEQRERILSRIRKTLNPSATPPGV